MSELFRLFADSIMGTEFRGGLVGWPVSHSLSPEIHSMFLEYFGIKGSYSLFPVKPENLKPFLEDSGNGRFAGLNVTLPHKSAAAMLCNSLSPEAQRTAAVNTLVFGDGGVRGYNTDIAGFKTFSADLPSPFFVVGSGGAAAAVSDALEATDYFVLKRGDVILPENRPAVATVVNATPLGWNDDDLFPFEIPDGWFFADLNYNPRWNWRNSLLSPVRTGEKMLVEQAAESFRLWTGFTPGGQLKLKVLERIREKLHG
ncbi:MAG: hypothetical protein J7K88_07360, partial [Candidatus Fermentibacteraceae bacterium]|nr:hypothetical protein [Candidatus Fermentibacteraceae bacterium]